MLRPRGKHPGRKRDRRMAADRNRQVLYRRRPEGMVTEDCFAFAETPIPRPAAGEVLLRVRYLSIDPYMRRQMLGVQGYPTVLREGGVMTGRGIAEVVESRHPEWQPGTLVLAETGWQEWLAIAPRGLQRVAPVDPPSLHLGLLGSSGETAWYGITRLGRPQPGETVVVSAASGAVGSAAGQIARLLGCRVIGIAGGAAKCAHVVERFGFDACLDYREPDLQGRLCAAAPQGVDVYFENVGGAVLDAVLPNLRMGARIPLCGLVSHYNAVGEIGFRNFSALLDMCVTLTGFRLGFVPRELRAEARQALLDWWREGRLRAEETVAQGLEAAPAALCGLFGGSHTGKQVVRLD